MKADIIRVSVPVFVIVIDVSLNPPTCTLPKLTEELLSPTTTFNGIPVPETVMVSGLEAALLVTKSLPEYPPTSAGAKRSVSLKNWPGKTIRMVGLAEKTPILEVIPEIFNVSAPLFVMVMDVSLNNPAFTLPKLTVALLSDKNGNKVVPVPDTPTVS